MFRFSVESGQAGVVRGRALTAQVCNSPRHGRSLACRAGAAIAGDPHSCGTVAGWRA